MLFLFIAKLLLSQMFLSQFPKFIFPIPFRFGVITWR